MQPRQHSQSHDGSCGVFSFYFKGTVFSLPLIALTRKADGIDPEKKLDLSTSYLIHINIMREICFFPF